MCVCVCKIFVRPLSGNYWSFKKIRSTKGFIFQLFISNRKEKTSLSTPNLSGEKILVSETLGHFMYQRLFQRKKYNKRKKGHIIRASMQTHKHTEYTIVRKKRERNNNSWDNNSPRTINLDRKFADTYPVIKKNPTLSKQSAHYKSKETQKGPILLTKDSVKRQKHVLKRNK